MKCITLTCLLVLLPIIDCSAASGNSKVAFDQPALWYGNAGGSGDTGPLPALSSDKWRLLLNEQGLHYVERTGSRSSELLSIPYEKIAAVRADPSERAYPTLVVELTDHSEGRPLSHVFLIMHPGAPDARSAAMEVKLLIENRMLGGPSSPANAPSAATEGNIQRGHRTSDAVREERIAISFAQWEPSVVFGDPEPVRSDNVNRFTDSVVTGTKFGAYPLAGCIQMGCPPEAILPGLGLVAVGAAVGAVVGAVRELVAALQKAPQPPGFSPLEVQAAAPRVNMAVGGALGQPAFHECVQRKLASSAEWREPALSTGAMRAASFTPVAGMGSPSPGEEASYATLSRDGYRYAIESHVPRVLLVPKGTPGQKAEDVPAGIMVEGGIKFVDLESGQSQQRSVHWDAAPRTLRDWGAADGAALNEALSIACDGLANQIVANAEEFWRQPRETSMQLHAFNKP